MDAKGDQRRKSMIVKIDRKEHTQSFPVGDPSWSDPGH